MSGHDRHMELAKRLGITRQAAKRINFMREYAATDAQLTVELMRSFQLPWWKRLWYRLRWGRTWERKVARPVMMVHDELLVEKPEP